MAKINLLTLVSVKQIVSCNDLAYSAFRRPKFKVCLDIEKSSGKNWFFRGLKTWLYHRLQNPSFVKTLLGFLGHLETFLGQLFYYVIWLQNSRFSTFYFACDRMLPTKLRIKSFVPFWMHTGCSYYCSEVIVNRLVK